MQIYTVPPALDLQWPSPAVGPLEEDLPPLAVELDGEEDGQGKHNHSSQEYTNLEQGGV